jgi:hypothetical protein
MPKDVAAALLASAEGYTPRATQLLEAARERLGTINEVAGWIAESLPQPKTGPTRARRRRRRKKKPVEAVPQAQGRETEPGEQPAAVPAEEQPARKRRRRRRRPTDDTQPESVAEGETPVSNGAEDPTPEQDAA